ncbi:hypothetical protein GTR04_2172 [Trichophyton interdigitale]|uniref:Uncharacterized protein n=1 Tax=Trichophyton interdigitale TaxID=101480 RepID=A0A9P5CWX7_9EURO|nr:hypothetical protein GY632_3955 [Trichophyton interdigitale]KAF3896388.1 hypothetical protein GY631_2105 [Trichophyton interdigitale]KAG8210431.1 hypothetical protein GTR04_2172 [Trichophyton interdigitale]
MFEVWQTRYAVRSRTRQLGGRCHRAAAASQSTRTTAAVEHRRTLADAKAPTPCPDASAREDEVKDLIVKQASPGELGPAKVPRVPMSISRDKLGVTSFLGT